MPPQQARITPGNVGTNAPAPAGRPPTGGGLVQDFGQPAPGGQLPTGGGLQLGGPQTAAAGLGGGSIPRFQPPPQVAPPLQGPQQPLQQPTQFGQQFGGVGIIPGSQNLSSTPTPITSRDIQGRQADFFEETGRKIDPRAQLTKDLLGPLGFIVDPSGFSRRQLPFIEARLNFENRLQAEGDRQGALDLLGFQRSQIGNSPGAQSAREAALRRLENPDPFSPEDLSIQQSQIRQRGAVGLEDAQRSLSDSLARQGLGGSGSAFQQAQLAQSGARQTSGELQRLAIDNALQSDQNEAQAIDRLGGIESEDELRRISLGQLLSQLLTSERGQFDLSGLAASGSPF